MFRNTARVRSCDLPLLQTDPQLLAAQQAGARRPTEAPDVNTRQVEAPIKEKQEHEVSIRRSLSGTNEPLKEMIPRALN